MKPRNNPPEMLNRLKELSDAIEKNPELTDSYICKQFTDAFSAGMISGEGWGEKAEIEYTLGVVQNMHFQQLLDASLSNKCPQDITIKIKDSMLDDAAMHHLARLITNPKCPAQLNIQIQGHTNITETGTNIILTALSNAECKPGVQIHLPQHLTNTATISEQVNENNKRYRSAVIRSADTRTNRDKKSFTRLFCRNKRAIAGTSNDGYVKLDSMPKKHN